MASMSAIEISGLRVRRGGKLVLPDLSLEGPAGAVTGLRGPSGGGETTRMRSRGGGQGGGGARGAGARGAGGVGLAAVADRVCDAGAVGVCGSDGARESALLRAGA